MKFGLFYEIQLPAPHQDADVTRMFQETLEHVELADRLGFHCMWGVEHHFLEDHALSSAPEVWLAAAAARTHHIRIGHGIACIPPGFSPPAKIAERVATLDQVSGGRVEFGTGESSSRMELEGYGVDVETKRDAYLEALEQICNMMTMTPYPGYDGEYFSMPCRNLVPKPAQKPHPPLWVAGKPDLAASLGMGCLGFNVVGGRQAKVMVDQYYETLATQCVPIGHAVNPQMSVLATLHCHRDGDVAREIGTNLRFFGYSVARYYLSGAVKPGRGDAWADFEEVKDQFPDMGDSPTSAIGTPDEIRTHLKTLDAAGIDQVLLLHQGGKLSHEDNCASLELFAREVMPEFLDGEDERESEKAARLEPAIEAALERKERMREMADDEIPEVHAYGRFSHMPTSDDVAIEQGTSDETAGALGVSRPPREERLR
jgi:alkanesulfonate monooxygenase SsuD/methylene tetrahydromethanopterin reductase-like flavin-dependent oxidoreductase (luciferase family)